MLDTVVLLIAISGIFLGTFFFTRWKKKTFYYIYVTKTVTNIP